MCPPSQPPTILVPSEQPRHPLPHLGHLSRPREPAGAPTHLSQVHPVCRAGRQRPGSHARTAVLATPGSVPARVWGGSSPPGGEKPEGAVAAGLLLPVARPVPSTPCPRGWPRAPHLWYSLALALVS